jgi:predicted GIY-YIG superfamily endonuclease
VAVYLVQCERPRHWYVGISTDFGQRATQHAEGSGALFTRRHGVRSMRLLVMADTPAEARQVERAVTLAGAGWATQGGHVERAGRLVPVRHPAGDRVPSDPRRRRERLAWKFDVVDTPVGHAHALVQMPPLRSIPHIPTACERHNGPAVPSPTGHCEHADVECDCFQPDCALQHGGPCCYCGTWTDDFAAEILAQRRP